MNNMWKIFTLSRTRLNMAAVFFVLFMGICVSSWGLVRQIELDELARSADVVLIGRVTQVQSSWNARRTAIFSQAQVATETVLKGRAASEVLVTYEGGFVDGMELKISEGVKLHQGQSVVLFLQAQADGTYCVVGRFQGIYTIMRQHGAAAQVVHPLYSEGYTISTPGFDMHTGCMQLDTFLQYIRQTG